MSVIAPFGRSLRSPHSPLAGLASNAGDGDCRRVASMICNSSRHTPRLPGFVGRLMYPEIGGFTGVTTVPERANMWTNSGFTAWIDQF